MKLLLFTLAALATTALAQIPTVPVPMTSEEKLEIQLAQERDKALSLEAQLLQTRFPQIAEERKAAQAAGQAKFQAVCARAKIPLDQCVPDLAAWTVAAKPPAAKAAPNGEVKK